MQKITNADGFFGDRFGEKIAVAGDTIAIVARDDDSLATDAGMVYLFDEQGQSLGFFGSPNAEPGGMFGSYITNIEDDRFLVAAIDEDDASGRAYIFDIRGELITTITAPEPLPDRHFGGRALLSNDESLFVGSWRERVDGTRTGVMYEFDHTGEYIGQINHPRLDEDGGNCLGRSAAFVGSSQIIVGDACAGGESGLFDPGAAFLFDINGDLQLIFDNPNPASLEAFGSSVAFADDRILIGGVQIHDLETGASTGAAYIYETDGTLITRVSDPEPRGGNWFGWNAGSMTLESGEEVFLVGSIFNSTSFSKAGKVFVVNRDGEILQALESPTPGPGQQFGVGFTQFGNKLLIGAPHDGGGFPEGAGAVWVFEPAELGDFDLDGNVDQIDLEILCGELSTGNVSVSWDITGDEIVDEQDFSLFLELTDQLPGDTDFDGRVTFEDFLTLSGNFGDPAAIKWSDGNFDCSGHVEFGDFLQLSANFGEVAPMSSVPEPQQSLWFLLLLCFALKNRRNARSGSVAHRFGYSNNLISFPPPFGIHAT